MANEKITERSADFEERVKAGGQSIRCSEVGWACCSPMDGMVCR